MKYHETEHGILYHGDCLEILPTLGVKADLVLTDPPYEFVSKNPIGGGFMDKQNKKHLDKISSSFGMSFSPTQYLSLIASMQNKTNGYYFTNKSLLSEYIGFAKDNDLKWDLLIWQKPNPVPINNNHYLFDKEYVVFIRQTGSTFNSNLDYKRYFTVISNPIGRKSEHPTEKPIRLIVSPLLISSNEQDLILDPFAGSGTTAIACIRYKRRYILIEKEEKYCEIAAKRIEAEIAQTDFLRDGEL